MKIYLACALGMSTSILVNKMKDEAKAQGKNYEIKAINQSIIEDSIDQFDVLLLGPQIGHTRRKIEKIVNGRKPVGVINPMDYGRGNGAAVLKQAEDLLNEF